MTKSLLAASVAVLLSYTYFLPAAGSNDTGVTSQISRFGVYPSWSPDTRRIVFTDAGAPGIWIYDRDKATTRQIHSPGGFPVWSPAGDKIAFRKDTQLWLIQADGTGATNTGVAVGTGLRWSPDSRLLLAYDGNLSPHDRLFVINATTFSRTELPFVRVGKNKKVGDCSWTPEGNLMLTAPVGDSGDWQRNELREYSLTGELVRRIHLDGFAHKPFDANISPDGKFIVFHRGSRGIWIAHRDGSGVRQVCSVGAAAEWSPDQKSIAYDDSSSTPGSRNGIFILDLDWSAKSPSGSQPP